MKACLTAEIFPPFFPIPPSLSRPIWNALPPCVLVLCDLLYSHHIAPEVTRPAVSPPRLPIAEFPEEPHSPHRPPAAASAAAPFPTPNN